MRLLVYLLALLTGLSAAEAARPVDSSSQTSAATSLELVEVLTHAAASKSIAVAVHIPRDVGTTEIDLAVSEKAGLPIAQTPVSRSDISRE